MRGIAAPALERLAGKLRVDAPQRDPLVVVLGLDRLHVGVGPHRVHAPQPLALAHCLALPHQDLLDDALLGGLHDLEVARGHEVALGHRDDVEATEAGPQDYAGDQSNQDPEHPAGEGRRRFLLDAQKRWRKIRRIGFYHLARPSPASRYTRTGAVSYPFARFAAPGLIGGWASRACLTSVAENGAKAKWQSGEMLRFATPSTLVRIQPSPPASFFPRCSAQAVVFARAGDIVPPGGA